MNQWHRLVVTSRLLVFLPHTTSPSNDVNSTCDFDFYCDWLWQWLLLLLLLLLFELGSITVSYELSKCSRKAIFSFFSAVSWCRSVGRFVGWSVMFLLLLFCSHCRTIFCQFCCVSYFYFIFSLYHFSTSFIFYHIISFIFYCMYLLSFILFVSIFFLRFTDILLSTFFYVDTNVLGCLALLHFTYWQINVS